MGTSHFSEVPKRSRNRGGRWLMRQSSWCQLGPTSGGHSMEGGEETRGKQHSELLKQMAVGFPCIRQ